jgi:hypothetical protein
MPSGSSFLRNTSQAAVSLPVSGRGPAFTVGTRTNSCSNSTISSRAASTDSITLSNSLMTAAIVRQKE